LKFRKWEIDGANGEIDGRNSSATRSATWKSSIPITSVFHLHAPWPDFLTYYSTLATGAAWIVPKKYIEQVGDDAFKQRPVGLGPYKFVSQTPGIEIIMEANETYWRKVPNVKRLVFKSVPEPTTRMAMIKKGEVDLAYLLPISLAEEVQRDPKLKLAFSGAIGIFWFDFLDQWDPKSPWHDKRVRLAANYALNRQERTESETLGASKLTGSMVPRAFEFSLPFEPYPYDPAKAKQLLAEAAYPNGFDAGDLTPAPPYFDMGESIANYLRAVGIKVKLRPMERAAFFGELCGKRLRGVCVCGTGRYGNAATRLEEMAVTWGSTAYGGYPDIDELLSNRMPKPTAASARPCCARSSSSSTSASCSGPSGNTSGRAPSDHAWRSRPSC
jgi:peptide/nickel transport system substrate-binding protein